MSFYPACFRGTACLAIVFLLSTTRLLAEDTPPLPIDAKAVWEELSRKYRVHKADDAIIAHDGTRYTKRVLNDVEESLILGDFNYYQPLTEESTSLRLREPIKL